jgi:hypothetical protein
MKNLRILLASTVGLIGLAMATPAMARDHGWHGGHGGFGWHGGGGWHGGTHWRGGGWHGRSGVVIVNPAPVFSYNPYYSPYYGYDSYYPYYGYNRYHPYYGTRVVIVKGHHNHHHHHHR